MPFLYLKMSSAKLILSLKELLILVIISAGSSVTLSSLNMEHIMYQLPASSFLSALSTVEYSKFVLILTNLLRNLSNEAKLGKKLEEGLFEMLVHSKAHHSVSHFTQSMTEVKYLRRYLCTYCMRAVFDAASVTQFEVVLVFSALEMIKFPQAFYCWE